MPHPASRLPHQPAAGRDPPRAAPAPGARVSRPASVGDAAAVVVVPSPRPARRRGRAARVGDAGWPEASRHGADTTHVGAPPFATRPSPHRVAGKSRHTVPGRCPPHRRGEGGNRPERSRHAPGMSRAGRRKARPPPSWRRAPPFPRKVAILSKRTTRAHEGGPPTPRERSGYVTTWLC